MLIVDYDARKPNCQLWSLGREHFETV